MEVQNGGMVIIKGDNIENGGLKIVKNYGSDKSPKEDKLLTVEELKEKIERVRTHIVTKRLWFPVCKYMMWRKMVPDGDFNKAVEILDGILPGLNLDAKDLSKLNVLSFRKKYDNWDINDAPVSNNFSKYLVIAELMDM